MAILSNRKAVLGRPVSGRSVSVIGLMGFVACASAPALAQSQASDAANVSEIVVTAQRRDEKSVNVPLTVQTLSAAQLATANVQNLSDISRVTPALRFDNQSAWAQPSIRGIGTAITTSGGGTNVGIYLDGFYSPNPLAADSQLMKVKSIQVLKGPQGTLFGHNTTGGAILIETADPSEKMSGQIKLSHDWVSTAAHQGALHLQSYFTTGLAPGLAFDIEGSYRQGDGYQTNIVGGDTKVGAYNNWSIRAGLKAELSPSITLLLRYQHASVDDPTSLLVNSFVDPVLGVGSNNFASPLAVTTTPGLVASDRPTFFRSKNDTVQATIKADLGFANLTSYSQWRREVGDMSTNLDNSGSTLFQLGLPITDSTVSQEFLLTSKAGNPLQWTAGLYYFSNKDTWLVYNDSATQARVPTGANRLGGSSTNTKSLAAFVDATYELTPQLFITAGARYAHDTVTDAYYNAGAAVFAIPSISGNKLAPRVVIRYKPSDNSSIYASYNKGYKAGIIDAGGSCQNGPAFVCNTVKPEDINAFEIGYKYGTRRLSFDAAAFYYDYKNLQVSLFTAAQANIINAAKSEIYGLEGSLRYDVDDHFQVNIGASWTHARYKQFNNAPVYGRQAGTFVTFPALAGITLNNVTMQHTPEFTGNIGARYKTELAGGKAVISGNLYHTSSFFFGPSGTQFPQKGYNLLSLRAEWTDSSDKFTIAAFADNVTNSQYVTQVQYNNFGLGAVWSKPRTVGIEVGVKF